MTDGVIKFQYRKTGPALPCGEQLDELNYWRSQLHELGLIGVDNAGIGFGNVSCLHAGQIIISASATGYIPSLDPSHYCLIDRYDIPSMQVHYTGALPPSSELLSHAVVYETLPEVKAVTHIHHFELWQRLRGEVLTTPDDVSYGTRQMAEALEKSVSTVDELPAVVVMGGHTAGILAIGMDVKSIAEYLISLHNKIVS